MSNPTSNLESLRSRLRNTWNEDFIALCLTAADEIERLQEESRQWDKASLVEIIAERERLRAALESIRKYPGLPAVIYGTADSALSGDSSAGETPTKSPFREVAVRQVLTAIDAWNKQDGRMCDHDYDLMNDARRELQWILDDHTRASFARETSTPKQLYRLRPLCLCALVKENPVCPIHGSFENGSGNSP